MPANSLRPTPVSAEELIFLKLEYIILTLLLHYGGRYEDSFEHWYSAVAVSVPNLADPQCLRDAFKQLVSKGIIELKKSISYPGRADAGEDNFLDSPFVAALTTEGVIHWVALRVAIKQAAAQT